MGIHLHFDEKNWNLQRCEGSVLMRAKTAQQNFCEKGGVPEAQPILGYDICKKGNIEPLENVERNLCKQRRVFFHALEPPWKDCTAVKKVGSTACAHDNTCVAKNVVLGEPRKVERPAKNCCLANKVLKFWCRWKIYFNRKVFTHKTVYTYKKIPYLYLYSYVFTYIYKCKNNYDHVLLNGW